MFLAPHSLQANSGNPDVAEIMLQSNANATQINEDYMKKIMTKGTSYLQEMAHDKMMYPTLMSCPNAELKFKLQTGDMLVFYYFPREDQPDSCILGRNACITLLGVFEYCSFNDDCIYGDHRLTHASCPIFNGTKYSLTYWMT